MVHWPGDPPFEIELAHDQKKGDPCTVSRVSMGVHTGTHMDAPLHFIEDAATIDEMPLDATVGPARVIQIRDRKSIGREELMEHEIEASERVLFKTANSDTLWSKDEFDEEFVFIAQGRRGISRGARRPDRRGRLSFGGRLQTGWRRNAPGAAGRGHLDYRRTESQRRGARRIRTDVSAVETRWVPKAFSRARDFKEHRVKAAAVFPPQEIAGRCERLPEPKLDEPHRREAPHPQCGRLRNRSRDIASFLYGTPPDGSDYLVIGHEAWAKWSRPARRCRHFKPGDLAIPMVRRPCDHPDASPAAPGRPDFCYTGDYREARHHEDARFHDRIDRRRSALHESRARRRFATSPYWWSR